MSDRDPARVRILDAAASTLRAKGLAGAKLSEIAQIAGMLAPSLYHHFPSKAHLVEEVMLEGIYRNTRYIVSHVEVLGPAAEPLLRLRAAIRAHIEFLLTGDDFSSAVSRVFEDLPDDVRGRVLAAYSAFDNYWRDLIVGSPDTVVEKTNALFEQCGGWGTLQIESHDYYDDPSPWFHSLELAAAEVAPRINLPKDRPAETLASVAA